MHLGFSLATRKKVETPSRKFLLGILGTNGGQLWNHSGGNLRGILLGCQGVNEWAPITKWGSQKMDVHPNEKVLRYHVYCIQQLLLPLLFLLLSLLLLRSSLLLVLCIYIYIYVYNVFHGPHPVFSSILYVHVSEMLCTCQRCFERFPAVVHVSQKLCTCHRSCARFTSALITFVFNCIHTERILISKSIGATKHVLLIYTCMYVCMRACMYVRTYVCMYVCMHACMYMPTDSLPSHKSTSGSLG